MEALERHRRRSLGARDAGRGPVDAAEDQGGIAEIELGEPVDQGLVEHVALVAGLEGAAEGGFVEVAQLPRVGRLWSRQS